MERKEENQTSDTSNAIFDEKQPPRTGRPEGKRWVSSANHEDDLVFDPDSFILCRMSEHGATGDVPSEEATPLVNQPSSSRRLRKLFKTALALCAAGLSAAVVISAVSFWYQGSYSVEAKLLFLGGDRKAKGVETWTIGEELGALTCSEVAFSAAQDVCMASTEGSSNGKGVRVQPASWADHDETASESMFQAMPGAQGLALWLRHELSVEPVESNGATGFRLQMRGPDVELLKTALAAYIRRYLEYSSTLESTNPAELRHTAADSEANPDPDETLSPDNQLRKLELLTRSFELALHSMDTGKGTFKGFIPDVSIAATPSLARFQDKLLELEIKKRGLAVQFTSNSKEMRSIDQEIRGVKAAMRECLSEYVEFLKQGKKGLASQKRAQEQGKSSKASLGKQANRRCSGQLPNGDAWFRIREGLYVFTSGPCVVSEPPLARVGEYTRSVLAWGSGRPPRPAVGSVAGSQGVGSARFASADEILTGREDYGHRLANTTLSSKDERNLQQEHIR